LRDVYTINNNTCITSRCLTVQQTKVDTTIQRRRAYVAYVENLFEDTFADIYGDNSFLLLNDTYASLSKSLNTPMAVTAAPAPAP